MSVNSCALFALLLAPVALAAQDGPPPPRDSASRALVQGLTVDRRPVYDLTEASSWYTKLMNQLHVTTREHVVRREMLVQPGQVYDSALAAESERNLRALNVFRLVRVDSTSSDSGLAARVVTGDAFTLKPYFSLRTSGTQASFGIGLTEANLLGNLVNVSAKYKHEPDRSSLEIGVTAPRIVADRVSIAASYANLSDGRRASFSSTMPFFSYITRSALGFDVQGFDGRVLRYLNGNPDPSDSLQRLFFLGRLQAGRAIDATSHGYVRVGLTAQIRREDFGPRPRPDTMPRTLTGALLPQAEARRAHFVVVRNYRNIGPDEDVDLSTTLRLGASLAPAGWGYPHTGVGPLLDLTTGAQFARGFAFLQAHATTLYRSAGVAALDSGTFTLKGTMVVQPTPRQTVVFFLGGGRQKNVAPGAEFDLGLTSGPRAFPQHSFTGDRVLFGSAEYRWTAIQELAKLVGIGIAAFVDDGGAWYSTEPRRNGVDAGFGLRIGSSRFPSLNGASRLDLAYRWANDVQPAGWVFVLGTGFVFEKVR